MTSHDCAAGPQIDERIDVAIERIWFRKNVQHAMDHHVRLERPHEQQRKGARIAAADDARVHRPSKVISDDGKDAARRAVLRIGIERHHERTRALMHVDGDILGNDLFHERHETLGDASKDHARIAARVDVLEIEDELRRRGDARAHRRAEEVLLRPRMPQDGRGSNAQLARDVGECRGIEAFGREHAPCGFQELLAGDPRRPAHL